MAWNVEGETENKRKRVQITERKEMQFRETQQLVIQ
jgi:hypothetical protein